MRVMTEQEKSLIYQGIGDYRGWKCVEIGGGLVVFRKGSKEVKAYRGFGVVDSWVEECWTEIKNQIDILEQE
jgi:hypothetical protein